MIAAGRIRRLPDHLVNKIAAGEVVERPASVVKELVENALDAGARAITVELRDGGTALVRVTDDGIGMTAEELALALERHATSKLAVEDDLDAIGTLGFRGEALPAICAVSRFTITTRPREAAAGDADPPPGTRVSGAGGVIAQRLAVPADAGTAVEVADLFFNTPARLKFLKAPATELAAALRLLTQLAIARPGVHLKASNNGRAVLNAPPARDLRARVGALWGWEPAERLLEVARSERGVDIRGVASPPDLTRANRDDVVIAVNGRPVRDAALFQAVLEAYRPLLARDRFPLVALSLTLPLEDVDVNVHPTKAWVRFRHPRLVQELIVAALGETLRQRAVVPVLGGGPATAGAPTSSGSPVGAAEGAGWAPGRLPFAAAPAAAAMPGLFAEAAAPYAGGPLGRVLGQVQDTFVVAASDREVFFVDQHAAHERVIFERLEADLRAGTAQSQALLFPETLALSPGARAALERWREPLERLGFAFEGFGGDAVVVRAVPAVLASDEPRRVLEAAADDLGSVRGGAPVVERVMSFVACRAAIKANTPLDRDAMERLIADLGATARPYFCPHGRPTMSRISLADIRREVRRLW